MDKYINSEIDDIILNYVPLGNNINIKIVLPSLLILKQKLHIDFKFSNNKNDMLLYNIDNRELILTKIPNLNIISKSNLSELITFLNVYIELIPDTYSFNIAKDLNIFTGDVLFNDWNKIIKINQNNNISSSFYHTNCFIYKNNQKYIKFYNILQIQIYDFTKFKEMEFFNIWKVIIMISLFLTSYASFFQVMISDDNYDKRYAFYVLNILESIFKSLLFMCIADLIFSFTYYIYVYFCIFLNFLPFNIKIKFENYYNRIFIKKFEYQFEKIYTSKFVLNG